MNAFDPTTSRSPEGRYRNLRVIAPLSALSKRTRLFKLAKFVHATRALRISLLGWERSAGEKEEIYLDFDVEKEYVVRGGGYGGRAVRAKYIVWMLRVFIRSLRYRHDDLIWALGFESAFPALLASKLKGFDVAFDDADRFSLLFPLPKFISSVVAVFERWTSRHATVHLIPGQERYDFTSKKFSLLKNMPSESEIEAARLLFKEKCWPKAKLVININGWLGDGRGMGVALALANNLIGRDVIFLLAGKLDCPEAIQLSRHVKTHYIGEVSNAEALASYYASDYVFTYYDPRSTINRLAESNKWGDAIKTGIGVIVNSEVITSRFLLEAGAAISVGYEDIVGLTDAILEVLEDDDLIKKHKMASVQLSSRYGYFEFQLEGVLNNLEVGDYGVR